MRDLHYCEDQGGSSACPSKCKRWLDCFGRVLCRASSLRVIRAIFGCALWIPPNLYLQKICDLAHLALVSTRRSKIHLKVVQFENFLVLLVLYQHNLTRIFPINKFKLQRSSNLFHGTFSNFRRSLANVVFWSLIQTVEPLVHPVMKWPSVIDDQFYVSKCVS